MTRAEAVAAACASLHASQESTPEIAIFLTGDPAAMKVAVAWRDLPVVWRFNGGVARLPEDPGLLWSWLWEHRKVDFAGLVWRCGLPLTWVENSFRSLQAARLIFPDGSLSKWATLTIRAQVAQSLKARRAKLPSRRTV